MRINFIITIWDLFRKASGDEPDPGPQEPMAECEPKDFSNIPSNIFSSDANSVYRHFCDNWSSRGLLKMTIDAKGDNRDPEPHLGRRTQPPNPDTWSH
ncbi:hypothetical protein DL770_003816 [Monosporascus sp. CRB-9-2]|nr:hypothetical protein DL770_003816 [Monosporascus sp. CRB-9-2]